MKSLLLVTVMSLSLEAIAQRRIEFDERQEKICYEQAKKAGCVKGGEEHDPACTEANKTKLTRECRQILGI